MNVMPSDRWRLPFGWTWDRVEYGGAICWTALTVGNDASVAPDGTERGLLHANERGVAQLVRDRNVFDPPVPP